MYITLDSTGANWNYINYLKEGLTVWDVGHYNGGNYEIRPAGSNTNRLQYTSAGHLTVTSFATAGNFTVESGGDVGIGTSNPEVPLHVHHTLASGASRTTPITMLRLHRTKEGAVEYTGFGSDIEFYGRTYQNATHRALGIIRLQINDDSTQTNGTSMHFRTHDAANGSTMTEKMRIHHNGNVGIGDTSPTEGKLVVSGNGTATDPTPVSYTHLTLPTKA